MFWMRCSAANKPTSNYGQRPAGLSSSRRMREAVGILVEGPQGPPRPYHCQIVAKRAVRRDGQLTIYARRVNLLSSDQRTPAGRAKQELRGFKSRLSWGPKRRPSSQARSAYDSCLVSTSMIARQAGASVPAEGWCLPLFWRA